MIVRIQAVDLQRIVIDILDAGLGLHPVEPDRFERQNGESRRRVLGRVWSILSPIGVPGVISPSIRWLSMSF
jgi:hypothetical protein